MERSSKRNKKSSMRLCHQYIKESRAFCKAQACGVLTLTPYDGCLTEVRQKVILGHNPQTLTTRVIRMRYPQEM